MSTEIQEKVFEAFSILDQISQHLNEKTKKKIEKVELTDENVVQKYIEFAKTEVADILTELRRGIVQLSELELIFDRLLQKGYRTNLIEKSEVKRANFDKAAAKAYEFLYNAEGSWNDFKRKAKEHYPSVEIPDISFKVKSSTSEVLKKMGNSENQPKKETQSPNQESSANGDREISDFMRKSLKEIPIDPYDGDPGSWQQWFTAFKSMVIDTDLPLVYKQNALKKYTTGTPRSLVERYAPNGSTFQEAIEMLKRTYGNERVIIKGIWEKVKKMSIVQENTIALRNAINDISAQVAKLERMGQDINSQILIQEIKGKFPRSIQLDLKRSHPGDFYQMEDLLREIETLIQVQEELDMSCKSLRYSSINVEISQDKKGRVNSLNRDFKKKGNLNCILCEENNHKAVKCKKFKTSKARQEVLESKGRCAKCARKGHRAKDCTERPECYHCKKTGHTAITCFEKIKALSQGERGTGEPLPWAKRNSRMNTRLYEDPERLLMVAKAIIKEPKTGKLFSLDMLMDSGAEDSFIKREIAEDLELPVIRNNIHMTVTGAGGLKHSLVSEQVAAELIDDENKSMECLLFTEDEIMAPVETLKLSRSDKKFLVKKGISCEVEQRSKEIQLLIGIDLFFKMLRFEKEKYDLPSGLQCVPTTFGYVICGVKREESRKVFTQKVEKTPEDHKLDSGIEAMWNMEKIGISADVEESQDDKYVFEHFEKNVKMSKDGRVVVALPFREGVQGELGTNFRVALKRLHILWDSASKNQSLWKAITESIEQQEKMGIVEEVREPPKGRSYVIPYLVVTKMESKTTKFRVVLDASSHEKGKLSLNQCLFAGPAIIPESPGLLIRTRSKEFLMISDVEKAFHQVLLREEDRDFARFLYLKNPTRPPTPENIRLMRYVRLPFGVSSAPFLLAQTIRHKTETEEVSEELKDAVLSNLYVDNLMIVSNDEERLKELYKESKKHFNKMSMNLREYASNSKKVAKVFAEKDASASKDQKVLGLLWNIEKDTYTVKKAEKISEQTVLTKRIISSALAGTHDPLGWFLPLQGPGKILLQTLWKNELEWDQKVPAFLADEFWEYQKTIQATKMEMPRAFVYPNGKYTTEIIIFTDASKKLYAAIAFLRAVNGKGECTINFLFAKSRLIPMTGVVTIARAELLSITIGTRIGKYLLRQMLEKPKKITICSDSEIALWWVRNNKSYKTFVQNRVREIRNTMSEFEEQGITTEFRHVLTKDNSADHATRKLNEDEIWTSNWFTGPEWLKKPRETWKATIEFTTPQEMIAEAKKEISTLETMETKVMLKKNVKEEEGLFNIYWTNNLYKIWRAIATVLIFIAKIGKGKLFKEVFSENFEFPKSSTLGTEWIEAAKRTLIRQHQKEYGIHESQDRDYRSINGIVCKWDRRGEEGIGRQERPVIKTNTRLSYLLIMRVHLENSHCGLNTLIGLVNECWHIKRIRQCAKTVLKICIRCNRLNSRPFPPAPTGPMPIERMTEACPFKHTALDMAGPFKNVFSDGTMSKVKAWVCLFNCMVTRALHIEVVYSLSTDEFLLALTRFMARRGAPETILCDNATTFVLANKILKDSVTLDDVREAVATKGIKFHFNAAAAPWQNGVSERLVALFKKSLLHSLGDSALSRSKFETICFEAERIVNCRPYIYVSDTDDKGEAIRPIDILLPKVRFPKFDVNGIQEEHGAVTEAYTSVQKFRERFWKIWRVGYLNVAPVFENSIQKKGAYNSRLMPQENEVVLIKGDQDKKHWKMGRVISLKPSRDGKIRSAILKLPSGRVTSRPLQLLVPFEVPEKRRTSVMGMMKTWMAAMLLMSLIVPVDGVRTFDEAASDWQNKKTIAPTTPFLTTNTKTTASTTESTIATTNTFTRVTTTGLTTVQSTTKRTLATFPVNSQETGKATTLAQAQEELRRERGGAKEFPQITTTTKTTTSSSTHSTTSKDEHKHRYPEDHVLDFEEMKLSSSEEKLAETKENFHVDEIHQAAKGKEHTQSDILCSQGGVILKDSEGPEEEQNIEKKKRYKVCAKSATLQESYCIEELIPSKHTMIPLPAEVTMHDHVVRWKKLENGQFVVLEKKCKAFPYCENIKCVYCWVNIVNPKCSQKRFTYALTSFAGLAVILLWILCVLRKPVENWNKFKEFIKKRKSQENPQQGLVRTPSEESLRPGKRKLTIPWKRRIWTQITRIWTRENSPETIGMEEVQGSRSRTGSVRFGTPIYIESPRPSRLALLATSIAITMSLLVQSVEACDQTFAITHKEMTCKEKICQLSTQLDVFITPLNKENCINILVNETVIGSFVFSGEYLSQKCVPRKSWKTRNVTLQSASVKACHNNGLCKDGRCAAVTRNTIVPELSYASQYPGATYCTTSCGGWGCSCWSLGEGCLFYRTYAQVTNSTAFEIFDCQAWKGKTAIKYSRRNPKNLEKVKMMMLNVGETIMESNALGDISVTLLDAKAESGNSYQHEKFLKSGESLAIAEKDAPEPALTCTETHCTYHERCVCLPDEDKAVCACQERDFFKEIESHDNGLPHLGEEFELTKSIDGLPVLKSFDLVAHLNVKFKGEIDIRLLETSKDCRVTAFSGYTGTYGGDQAGAIAEILCYANGDTSATLKCGEDFIKLILCNEKGTKNTIRRKFDKATIHETCTVKCGEVKIGLSLIGTLVYSGPKELTERTSNVISYSNGSLSLGWPKIPDVGHILSHAYGELPNILFKILIVVAIIYALKILAPWLILKFC